MSKKTALLLMWWVAVAFTVAYLVVGGYLIAVGQQMPEAVFLAVAVHLGFAWLVNRHIPE